MLAQMRTGQGGEKPPAGLPALGSALLILLLVAPAFPQSPVPSEPASTESTTSDPDASISGESPSGVTGERDPVACAWEARPADAKVARVLRERARRLADERVWLEAGESAYGAAVLYPPAPAVATEARRVRIDTARCDQPPTRFSGVSRDERGG